MCLEALWDLPPGPAVDAGCGSGLLAQAWARLGRGPVIACDLDPRALDQAGRSLAAAGLVGAVALRRAPVEALAPDELAGAVVMANLPLAAHRALLARVGAPPAAVVLAGLRPAEAAAVGAAWAHLGLRPREARDDGRFACLVMAA
jgi:ribosomal protein L11 methylase PrmA